MMHRFHCFIVILTILVSLPVRTLGQAEFRYSRAQIDSMMNPKPLKNGDLLLDFKQKSYDLGNVKDSDEIHRCQFCFKNISDRAIKITHIKTTCGCTDVIFDSTFYNPQESGIITLLYSPEKRGGEIDIKGFVYSSESETSPTTILTLKGNVIKNDKWDYLPYSIGALRIKRKRVTFEPIGEGLKPEMRIVCANSGNESIKLTATNLPHYVKFATAPEIIEPNTEAEIIITIDGSTFENRINGAEFSFQIEGIEAQTIERTIKVTIEKR